MNDAEHITLPIVAYIQMWLMYMVGSDVTRDNTVDNRIILSDIRMTPSFYKVEDHGAD